mmetsp:Transcript_17781/g.36894  ORF Transcript_17781/g.36894 Transcript_17781/m.36894 type:complete len:80 (-) Transcript_17781:611-850(-)
MLTSKVAIRMLTRRSIHSSSIVRGGHHEPDYVHAKYMYNLRNERMSKPVAAAAVGGAVAFGIGVPFFAVWFSQKKAGVW